MKPRSKKGQLGVTTAYAYIGYIVIFVVIALFVVRAVAEVETKGKGAACCSSLKAVYRVESGVEIAEDKMTIDVPCDWEHIKSGTDKCGNAFVNWAAGDPAGHVNKGIEKLTDGIKSAAEPTCRQSSYDCIGDAAYVGDCIYKKAAEGFYALGGGTPWAKTDMDIYVLNVNVTGPGTASIRGNCDDYIYDMPVIKQCGITDETSKYSAAKYGYPCYKDYTKINDEHEEEEWCDITFDAVDSDMMTLSMISTCSNAMDGPFDSSCKCFVKDELGYSCGLENGLPSVYSSNPTGYSYGFDAGTTFRTVEYGEDIVQVGCGWGPVSDSGEICNEHVRIITKLDGDVQIWSNGIEWRTVKSVNDLKRIGIVKWEDGGAPIPYVDYSGNEYYDVDKLYIRVDQLAGTNVICGEEDLMGWAVVSSYPVEDAA